MAPSFLEERMDVPEIRLARDPQELQQFPQKPPGQEAPPKPVHPLDLPPTEAELLGAQILADFEKEVAEAFQAKKIRAPIHLSGSADLRHEIVLMRLFRDVRMEDWCCGTWRFHYQCLLKGVPRERLLRDIIDGRSITLCYREHRIVTSAIVGGICSIAVGIAGGIQNRLAHDKERVWCFIGDMSAAGSEFHGCAKFGAAHGLPIIWVIENNGLSVCTPTASTWGTEAVYAAGDHVAYGYKLKWPHQGTGTRVEF